MSVTWDSPSSHTSQRQEGWRVFPTQYADGGYSGGSMDRPALHQLLQDVRDEKISIIVVYKVDRLTRSLADFAGHIGLPFRVSETKAIC